MVQRGQNFRFALKPRKAVSVGGEHVGQNLDGHRPFQIGVSRTIHLAHATRPERRLDLVRSQPSANSEAHFSRRVVQLTMTVSGAALACRGMALSRNRLPSLVTAHLKNLLLNAPVWKRACGSPASNRLVASIGTAIIIPPAPT